jgi:sortase A
MLQWVLVAGGLTCLLSVAVIQVRVWLTQWRVAEIAGATARQDVVLDAAPAAGREPSPPLIQHGAVVGFLTIPRLRLASAVLEGDDDAVLRVAAGHLADTPYPWQSGNATLSGHRDSTFRALRSVHVGDTIALWTTHGTFAYRVSHTFVVDPEALWVLRPPDKDVGLTLITCFPFRYVGSAPQRFIVQAERIVPAAAGAAGAVEDALPPTGSNEAPARSSD